jgi:hypothetical protein
METLVHSAVTAGEFLGKTATDVKQMLTGAKRLADQVHSAPAKKHCPETSAKSPDSLVKKQVSGSASHLVSDNTSAEQVADPSAVPKPLLETPIKQAPDTVTKQVPRAATKPEDTVQEDLKPKDATQKAAAMPKDKDGEPASSSITLFLAMTYDSALGDDLSGTIRGDSEDEMLERTNSNNMNPNRDTARLLNYKEHIPDTNVVAVSLVDCVAESSEFVKLDFTETHKSARRAGFISALQLHVNEHSLPQGIKLIMLDYIWLPVSRSWLMQGYLSNDFGMLQNIASLAQRPDTESHIADGGKVIIPINITLTIYTLTTYTLTAYSLHIHSLHIHSLHIHYTYIHYIYTHYIYTHYIFTTYTITTYSLTTYSLIPINISHTHSLHTHSLHTHSSHTLLLYTHTLYSKVIIPINYVMWNLMTESKYWGVVMELFEVSTVSHMPHISSSCFTHTPNYLLHTNLTILTYLNATVPTARSINSTHTAPYTARSINSTHTAPYTARSINSTHTAPYTARSINSTHTAPYTARSLTSD